MKKEVYNKNMKTKTFSLAIFIMLLAVPSLAKAAAFDSYKFVSYSLNTPVPQQLPASGVNISWNMDMYVDSRFLPSGDYPRLGIIFETSASGDCARRFAAENLPTNVLANSPSPGATHFQSGGQKEFFTPTKRPLCLGNWTATLTLANKQEGSKVLGVSSFQVVDKIEADEPSAPNQPTESEPNNSPEYDAPESQPEEQTPDESFGDVPNHEDTNTKGQTTKVKKNTSVSLQKTKNALVFSVKNPASKKVRVSVYKKTGKKYKRVKSLQLHLAKEGTFSLRLKTLKKGSYKFKMQNAAYSKTFQTKIK